MFQVLVAQNISLKIVHRYKDNYVKKSGLSDTGNIVKLVVVISDFVPKSRAKKVKFNG